MHDDFRPFEYGRKDGTIQSENEFYSEHSDIVLTPVQKERLEQNLEVQCVLILREFLGRAIIPQGFFKTIIFKDSQTEGLYLKPLYELNIKVFFKRLKLILIIYDIKMA